MRISAKVAVGSLSFGALAYFFPFYISSMEWHVVTVLCLAILWGGVFVSCLVRFGRTGLWFLAGAPLVMFWPLYLLFFVWIYVSGSH